MEDPRRETRKEEMKSRKHPAPPHIPSLPKAHSHTPNPLLLPAFLRPSPRIRLPSALQLLPALPPTLLAAPPDPTRAPMATAPISAPRIRTCEPGTQAPLHTQHFAHLLRKRIFGADVGCGVEDEVGGRRWVDAGVEVWGGGFVE